MGSCCFCNTDTDGINSTVCYDYMTQAQCLELGGNYNTTLSCSKRGADPLCRSAIPENGACCTCGTNYDDGTSNVGSCTQSLSKQQCLDLGFIYYRLPSGADCSHDSVQCDALTCGDAFAAKKKIIKLASKTYPTDFTCGIDEEGNVICWGEYLGTKTLPIRITKEDKNGDGEIDCDDINNINDWFADDVVVGEKHILILAKPIDYITCKIGRAHV